MNTTSKPTDTTSPRVLHGGSWYYSDPSGVRAANRYWDAVSTRVYYLGFRCALRGRQPLKVTP